MSHFPDFIIAGSAKSGTTALTMMLDQHPDTFMSTIKETNYFVHAYEPTRHLTDHRGNLVFGNQDESDIIDTLPKYRSMFKDASAGQILGEASPWYLINTEVPERIKEHNDKTKIVIVLRNPSDVAFANFVHQVRDRGESFSLADIDKIFEQDHYRKNDLHPFGQHLALPEYSRHLPSYLETFDPSQMYIMIYEEFLQNRRDSIGGLFEFLGVTNDVDIDVDKRVNISGLPKSEKVQDLIQGSMGMKKFIGLLVPKKPRRKIRAYIEALNTGEKAKMEDHIREKLDTLYTKDIEFVENIFGRNISAWRSKRLV